MNPGSMLVMFNRNLSARSDNTCWEKPTPTTEDWAEVGVTNSANDQYAEYFTYDNNEGEWKFHGAAKPGWFFPVKIYVTSTQDAQGYVYNSYIDNKIVRAGHLKSRLTGMNNANEIWVLKGNPFSHDRDIPTFSQQYLIKSDDVCVPWDSSVSPGWGVDKKGYAHEGHYMDGATWKFYSWNT